MRKMRRRLKWEGRTTHPPNAKERPLAAGQLHQEPGTVRRAAGVTTPQTLCENRGPAKPGANERPERGRGGGEGVGRGAKSAAESGRAPPGSRAAAGHSLDLPGEETPAASLTCQTLALRPEARTPGRFVSCGTQPLLSPELQDPRVESGTEVGRVATGPEPREVYIGGTGGPGRQLRVHLPHRSPTTLAGNSIAPTSARCSRALARSSPTSSGRVSGGNTPPPRYLASAILLEAGRIQCACVSGDCWRPPALRRGH